MKPYMVPAIVVGILAFVIGGTFAGIGFGLAAYYYGKHSYCVDMNRDAKLLREVRQEVRRSRFDTQLRRAYTKTYP